MSQQEVHILGIAPYEDLKTKLLAVAAERKDVVMDVYIGDLETGLKIAQKNHHKKNYDVIISRGGTAEILSSAFEIPVIDVEISAYDILSTLKMAEISHGHYAIVAFPSVVKNVQILCDLMQYDLDVYTWQKSEDIPAILCTIQNKQYDMILCDTFASSVAHDFTLNFNSILIASSVESTKKAVNEAVRQARIYNAMLERQRLASSLLYAQDTEIAVFDEDRNCVFSSIRTLQYEVMESYFQNALACEDFGKEPLIQKKIEDFFVSMQCRILQVNGKKHWAFYVSYTLFNSSFYRNGIDGIQFYNKNDVAERFLKNFQSIDVRYCEESVSLKRLNQILSPIMIFGEYGTNQLQLSASLYMSGAFQNRPFAVVDVSNTDEQFLRFLTESARSPLQESNMTFYIYGLEKLPVSELNHFASMIQDTCFCKRNRVIFSYMLSFDQPAPEKGKVFSETLSCVDITMLPLRKRKAELSILSCIYLSNLNAELCGQVVGFMPEALEAMNAYHWPHNLIQMQKVIQKMILLTEASYITAETVKNVLAEEQTDTNELLCTHVPFSLDRPLAKIEYDICLAVLEKCAWNQTKAAKQLGISRTTLWRILKNS